MNNNPQSSHSTKAAGSIPYTLRNDLMFHKVMQYSNKALTSLVCAIEGIPTDEVRSVRLLNPINYSFFDGKEFILDVLVELNSRKLLVIELQIYHDNNWIMRSLLYLGRSFDSLGFGDQYNKLKPTTMVSIMGYTLFPDAPEFYAHYELRNVRTGRPYTSNFKLNVLDLSKTALATEEDIVSGLKDWAALFNAAEWKELYDLSRKNDAFKEVCTIMEALNTIPQERTIFEAHRRWVEQQSSLTYDLEHTRAELDTTREQLSSAQSRLDFTQSRLDSTQSKLESTQSRLDSAQSKLDSTQSKLDSTQEQLDSAIASLHDEQKRVAELESRIRELTG